MGKIIMIVEDEPAFHDLYTMMLEDTDYEIIRAYDGDEALSKLEEKKPDLIILDIMMPKMNAKMCQTESLMPHSLCNSGIKFDPAM